MSTSRLSESPKLGLRHLGQSQWRRGAPDSHPLILLRHPQQPPPAVAPSRNRHRWLDDNDRECDRNGRPLGGGGTLRQPINSRCTPSALLRPRSTATELVSCERRQEYSAGGEFSGGGQSWGRRWTAARFELFEERCWGGQGAAAEYPAAGVGQQKHIQVGILLKNSLAIDFFENSCCQPWFPSKFASWGYIEVLLAYERKQTKFESQSVLLLNEFSP